MPGDTALPQTATTKTSDSLWYCGIIGYDISIQSLTL